MRNWLLAGYAQNWYVALKEHMWGLADTYTYTELAQQIENGDRVFFYVTSPVTGVVGYGRIQGKLFKGNNLIWNSEVMHNEVIFLHRFRFRITSLLPRKLWKSQAIRLVGRTISPGRLRGITQLDGRDAGFILRQTKVWKTHRGSMFLCHSHADNHFCNMLASDLGHRGILVWIDEAEMLVGDSLIQKISKAIDEMDYVAIVLSKSSVKSHWVRKELDIAMTHEIKGKRVKVLPILLEDCSIPSFLDDKVYADFREPSEYRQEVNRIVKRVRLKPKH